MMSVRKISTIFILLCSFSVFGYPQNAEADAARRRQEAENLRQQQERDLSSRKFILDNLRRDNGANRTNAARVRCRLPRSKKGFGQKFKNCRDKTESYFQIINRDERNDLIIALRIIRKEADGNLTIIWEQLDEKKSPEIVFSNK